MATQISKPSADRTSTSSTEREELRKKLLLMIIRSEAQRKSKPR